MTNQNEVQNGVKITKERQTGLLSLVVTTDEMSKSGKVSKRLVRQDTKDIAIMFCQLNKVTQPGGMPLKHASDLLGVPHTTLKEWLLEHDTLIIESDKEYVERLAKREKVLLDTLFNPLDMAIQEITNRLQNEPGGFSNKELLTIISSLSEQYGKVHGMRLDRESKFQNESSDNGRQNYNELREIFNSANERLIIDQK